MPSYKIALHPFLIHAKDEKEAKKIAATLLRADPDFYVATIEEEKET